MVRERLDQVQLGATRQQQYGSSMSKQHAAPDIGHINTLLSAHRTLRFTAERYTSFRAAAGVSVCCLCGHSHWSLAPPTTVACKCASIRHPRQRCAYGYVHTAYVLRIHVGLSFAPIAMPVSSYINAMDKSMKILLKS